VNYSRDDLLSSMLPVYRDLIAAGLKLLVFSGDVDAIVPVGLQNKWRGFHAFMYSKAFTVPDTHAPPSRTCTPIPTADSRGCKMWPALLCCVWDTLVMLRIYGDAGGWYHELAVCPEPHHNVPQGK
jgi:hypothetical protein